MAARPQAVVVGTVPPQHQQRRRPRPSSNGSPPSSGDGTAPPPERSLVSLKQTNPDASGSLGSNISGNTDSTRSSNSSWGSENGGLGIVMEAPSARRMRGGGAAEATIREDMSLHDSSGVCSLGSSETSSAGSGGGNIKAAEATSSGTGQRRRPRAAAGPRPSWNDDDASASSRGSDRSSRASVTSSNAASRNSNSTNRSSRGRGRTAAPRPSWDDDDDASQSSRGSDRSSQAASETSSNAVSRSSRGRDRNSGPGRRKRSTSRTREAIKSVVSRMPRALGFGKKRAAESGGRNGKGATASAHGRIHVTRDESGGRPARGGTASAHGRIHVTRDESGGRMRPARGGTASAHARIYISRDANGNIIDEGANDAADVAAARRPAKLTGDGQQQRRQLQPRQRRRSDDPLQHAASERAGGERLADKNIAGSGGRGRRNSIGGAPTGGMRGSSGGSLRNLMAGTRQANAAGGGGSGGGFNTSLRDIMGNAVPKPRSAHRRPGSDELLPSTTSGPNASANVAATKPRRRLSGGGRGVPAPEAKEARPLLAGSKSLAGSTSQRGGLVRQKLGMGSASNRALAALGPSHGRTSKGQPTSQSQDRDVTSLASVDETSSVAAGESLHDSDPAFQLQPLSVSADPEVQSRLEELDRFRKNNREWWDASFDNWAEDASARARMLLEMEERIDRERAAKGAVATGNGGGDWRKEFIGRGKAKTARPEAQSEPLTGGGMTEGVATSAEEGRGFRSLAPDARGAAARHDDSFNDDDDDDDPYRAYGSDPGEGQASESEYDDGGRYSDDGDDDDRERYNEDNVRRSDDGLEEGDRRYDSQEEGEERSHDDDREPSHHPHYHRQNSLDSYLDASSAAARAYPSLPQDNDDDEDDLVSATASAATEVRHNTGPRRVGSRPSPRRQPQDHRDETENDGGLEDDLVSATASAATEVHRNMGPRRGGSRPSPRQLQQDHRDEEEIDGGLEDDLVSTTASTATEVHHNMGPRRGGSRPSPRQLQLQQDHEDEKENADGLLGKFGTGRGLARDYSVRAYRGGKETPPESSVDDDNFRPHHQDQAGRGQVHVHDDDASVGSFSVARRMGEALVGGSWLNTPSSQEEEGDIEDIEDDDVPPRRGRGGPPRTTGERKKFTDDDSFTSEHEDDDDWEEEDRRNRESRSHSRRRGPLGGDGKPLPPALRQRGANSSPNAMKVRFADWV